MNEKTYKKHEAPHAVSQLLKDGHDLIILQRPETTLVKIISPCADFELAFTRADAVVFDIREAIITDSINSCPEDYK